MEAERRSAIYVWLFLTVITVASWWMGRSGAVAYQVDELVTYSVLIMAAAKSYFVLNHFMEVRQAPIWLKRTVLGWLVFLFLMLAAFYFFTLP